MSDPSWDSPAAVASFRAAEAASATRLAPIFLDDDTVKRFLRARKGEPGAALSMLLEHQAWRKAETPWWPLAAAPAEGLREDFACLKAYLDGTRASDAVMVIGDWNDDVDVSIATPNATPYANFVADGAHVRFATRELSDAHRGTTVSASSTIDHQLYNAALFPAYVVGSAAVVVQAIDRYAATTTDHYPVLTRYTFR